MSTRERWHSGCPSRLMVPSCRPLTGTGRTRSPVRWERPGASTPRPHVPGPVPTASTKGVLVAAPSPQEDREVVVGDLLILTLRGEVDIAVADPLAPHACTGHVAAAARWITIHAAESEAVLAGIMA